MMMNNRQIQNRREQLSYDLHSIREEIEDVINKLNAPNITQDERESLTKQERQLDIEEDRYISEDIRLSLGLD